MSINEALAAFAYFFVTSVVAWELLVVGYSVWFAIKWPDGYNYNYEELPDGSTIVHVDESPEGISTFGVFLNEVRERTALGRVNTLPHIAVAFSTILASGLNGLDPVPAVGLGFAVASASFAAFSMKSYSRVLRGAAQRESVLAYLTSNQD